MIPNTVHRDMQLIHYSIQIIGTRFAGSKTAGAGLEVIDVARQALSCRKFPNFLAGPLQ